MGPQPDGRIFHQFVNFSRLFAVPIKSIETTKCVHEGYRCETQISWEDFTLNLRFSTGRCNFFSSLSGLRLWGLRSQFIRYNDSDERLPDMVINPETCQNVKIKEAPPNLFREVARWCLHSSQGACSKVLQQIPVYIPNYYYKITD